MTLLLWLACAGRRAPEAALDPLGVALVEADAAWERRAEEGGLDRAVAGYEALLEIGAADPRLLARLSRSRWYRAYAAGDPTAARDHFETGRAFGTDCLLGFTAFRTAVEAARWSITEEAVRDLDLAAVPCLTWTAANGLSLVEQRGAGAALEVASLRPLALRAAALEPDGAEGYVAWVAAAAILLDRTPAPPEIRAAELASARDWLARAVRLAPDDPFLLAEQARWGHRPLDDAEPAP